MRSLVFAVVTLAATLVMAGATADAVTGPKPLPRGPASKPKVPTGPVKPPQPPSKKSKPKPTPKTHSNPTPKVKPSTYAHKLLKGDLSCRQGDPDCNRCMNDVEGQFRRIRDGNKRRRRKPWRFEWNQEYRPIDLKPFETFDDDSPKSNALALSKAHVQGFVRTNSRSHPFAGSHSMEEEGKDGSIFIVEQRPGGKKYLAFLHKTTSRHPSGVHILGKYLLFGDGRTGTSPRRQDRLRVIDLTRAHREQDIFHRMPNPHADGLPDDKLFGGGIGIAKIEDGSYLLVATQPGNRDKERRRYHRFYRVTGDLSTARRARIQFIREQTYVSPSRFGDKDLKYSENMSLITECRTGTIYAFHTSGDGEAADGLEGGGYWRLSKLSQDLSGPKLDPIEFWEVSQDAQNCHLRSAASAGMNHRRKLELLCHQFRKDPDPAVFNWFQGNTSGDDRWNFVTITPK